MSRIALLAAILLAASLRFSSLDFGGGVLAAHPDEPATIDAIEATRASRASYFHLAYGGGYVYPLYGFVRVVERFIDVEAIGTGSPRTDAGGHPYGEYVVARSWSALLSTLAVGVTAVLGWRVGGPATGVLAALLMAVSPVAVRDAHFAKADSASLLAATMLLVVLIGRADRATWVARVGLAAGLVLSIKYQIGVLPAVVFAVVARRDHPGPALRRLIVAGLVAALVVVGLNSFWLWAPQFSQAMVRTLVRSQYHYVGYPWFAGYAPSPISYHAGVSLVHGLGWPVAVLSLPALVIGLVRRGPLRIIAIAVLGQWCLLILNPLTLSRNFLPLAPGLIVLVMSAVTGMIRASIPTRFQPYAVAAAATVFICQPVGNAIRMVQVLAREDTRVLAYHWLENHVPAGATLAIYGTPPGAPSYGFPVAGLGRWKVLVAKSSVPLPQHAGPVWEVSHSSPLPYSSGPKPPTARSDQRLAVFDPFSTPDVSAVFEPFDAFYVPLAGFDGVVRPGPRIEIRLASLRANPAGR